MQHLCIWILSQRNHLYRLPSKLHDVQQRDCVYPMRWHAPRSARQCLVRKWVPNLVLFQRCLLLGL